MSIVLEHSVGKCWPWGNDGQLHRAHQAEGKSASQVITTGWHDEPGPSRWTQTVLSMTSTTGPPRSPRGWVGYSFLLKTNSICVCEVTQLNQNTNSWVEWMKYKVQDKKVIVPSCVGQTTLRIQAFFHQWCFQNQKWPEWNWLNTKIVCITWDCCWLYADGNLKPAQHMRGEKKTVRNTLTTGC